MAWEDSASVAFAYRMVYSLPPNDPGFLEMTEEAMAYDLLVQGWCRARAEDQRNPSTVDHGDPKARAKWAKRKEAAVQHPSVAAILEGLRAKLQATKPTVLTSITLSSTITP